MTTVSIEVKTGGQVFQVKAAICEKCGSKIYPPNLLKTHVESHSIDYSDVKARTCKCGAIFTVPKSGPCPSVCPDCRVRNANH